MTSRNFVIGLIAGALVVMLGGRVTRALNVRAAA